MMWEQGTVVKPWVVRLDSGPEVEFTTRQLCRNGTSLWNTAEGCRVYVRSGDHAISAMRPAGKEEIIKP